MGAHDFNIAPICIIEPRYVIIIHMFRWREQEKIIALELRKKGKSYREIQKEISGISRSTLAIWFRNITLSPKAAKILEKKKERAEKNVLAWSRKRSELATKRNIKAVESRTKMVGKLSRRDLSLIGAALYWGEGSLRARRNPYPHYKTEFSNSSPEMVKVFMRFAREILGVSEDQFRPHVQIYPNLDAEKSIKFWSEVTGIPTSYFRSYIQVSRASKHKRPVHFLPHGTLQVRLNNPENFYKIRGYIEGIKENV